MKTKLLRLVAALITVSLCVISCASNPSSSIDPSESTEQTGTETSRVPETVIKHSGDPDNEVRAKAYLASLPEHDFDGASFIITAPDPFLFEPSEISYISKDISERNRAVEEKYNVTISAEKSDIATMYEQAKTSAAAGMFYSHVMIMPQMNVPTFDGAGLLMNLRSMPCFDMTAPYFNASSAAALSVGDRTLGIAGEALPASTGLTALVYNKNIANAIGEDTLYSTAVDGLLTWDVVNEYYAAALALGYIGGATDGADAIDALYIASGQNYISAAEGRTPSVAIANYSMNSAALQYRTMRDIAAKAGVGLDGAYNAFREGKVLFTIAKIGELDSLNSENTTLGVLPIPKTVSPDADVKSTPYRHLADGLTEVFTVTADVTDSVMVSLVLSALNAASYGKVTESLADYLHATLLPDSRSADIYEIMAKSATYDMASAYSTTYDELAAGTVSLVRYIIESGDFSAFQSSVDAANRYLANEFSAGK